MVMMAGRVDNILLSDDRFYYVRVDIEAQETVVEMPSISRDEALFQLGWKSNVGKWFLLISHISLSANKFSVGQEQHTILVVGHNIVKNLVNLHANNWYNEVAERAALANIYEDVYVFYIVKKESKFLIYFYSFVNHFYVDSTLSITDYARSEAQPLNPREFYELDLLKGCIYSHYKF